MSVHQAEFWNARRCAYLREAWGDLTITLGKMAKHLDVSRNAVTDQAMRLGLPPNRARAKPAYDRPETQKPWDPATQGRGVS